MNEADFTFFLDHFSQAIEWLLANVLVVSALYQVLAAAITFIFSYFLASLIKKSLATRLSHTLRQRHSSKFSLLESLLLPLIWCILQWILYALSAELDFDRHITNAVASLLTAWILIRFSSSFVREPALSKLVAVSAWLLAALSILNLLGPVLAGMDQLAFNLGEVRLSLLSILKGTFFLVLTLWLAMTATSMLDSRVQKTSLDPSLKVLFTKLIRIGLLAVVFFLALSTVGIDITAFAVLGGAIGVGIGFGLQKVVSNLICGVILLMDHSIRPGAVISIDGEEIGWVNKLSARYVSVRTRDGQEHLIPNEDFITQKVENWSFSDNNVRIRIPIGVSYNADIHEVMRLCIAASKDVPRVLEDPPPVIHLRGFGDSSVDLELRMWIGDPENGIGSVKSVVLLKIWDSFKENNIEIPFPQRDLHIKTSSVISRKFFHLGLTEE